MAWNFGPTYSHAGFPYTGQAKKRKPVGSTAADPARPWANPWATPTFADIAGLYDPAYDAQIANANTGRGYAVQDYERGVDQLRKQAYGDTDFGTVGSVGELDTSYQQRLGQARTAHARSEEDWRTATGNVNLNFQRLGNRQSQQARAAGVAGGGALQQALQKRQGNQAREQGVLDTARNRETEDFRTLVGPDEQGGTLGGAYRNARGGLLEALTRQEGEAALEVQRNQAQADAFIEQLRAQAVWQAKMAGLLPVPPPKPFTPTVKGISTGKKRRPR